MPFQRAAIARVDWQVRSVNGVAFDIPIRLVDLMVPPWTERKALASLPIARPKPVPFLSNAFSPFVVLIILICF